MVERSPRQRGPRPGDLVYIGLLASVQFGGLAAFCFRVIRVHDWSTYDGWCWLDGYQLNASGDAVERRSIFVQMSGLRPATLQPRGKPVTGAPLRSARVARSVAVKGDSKGEQERAATQ